MAKVSLSLAAINDLKSIFEYIATDSEFYAQRVVDNILTRIMVLENHIRAGHIVREFGKEEIREIKEGSYRIIYRIENEAEISIVRIYHGVRLLKDL